MAIKNIEEIWRSTSGAAYAYVTSSVYTGGSSTTVYDKSGIGIFNFLYVKNTGATGTLRVGYSKSGVETDNQWYAVRPGEEYKTPTIHARLVISGTTNAVSYSVNSGWCGAAMQSFSGSWDELV